jgi:hypothetical protein
MQPLKPRIVSRKFFDFARIKREDLFEVVARNNEFRNTLAHKSIAFMGPNKTAKQKYESIRRTTQPHVLCFFLACSRKRVAKAFRLCETKRNYKEYFGLLHHFTFYMYIVFWIPAFPHDMRLLRKLVVRSRE